MSGRLVDMAGLVEAAEQLLKEGGPRKFFAIAGAPGSGKSTTAERLCEALEKRHPGAIALLPMDGFHFDDTVLDDMGRRPWKGAPDTFDVSGLRYLLQRLHDPDEGAVAVPVFDRKLEISRGSARIIPANVQLIIVEGNYILLNDGPWRSLAPLFDLTALIDVPEEELRRRLRNRWVGFGLDEAQIAHKLDGNDLPNGRAVRERSRPADLIFRQ